MTVATARQISTHPEVLKRLAKYLAQQCFRNTVLEDLHAGITVVLQVSNADKFVAERLSCILGLPSNRRGCR